jgi:hypothetical protein
MPRGLRTTRQTQQHRCQTEPQPRRRSSIVEVQFFLKEFWGTEQKKYTLYID